MARRRSNDPSKSRSLAVRLAHLRPSHRQLSHWQRDQQQTQMIRIGIVVFVALIAIILIGGFVREAYLRGQETVADVYGQTISLNQLAERSKPQGRAIDEQIRMYSAQGLTQQATQLAAQKNRLADTVLDQLIEETIVRRETGTRGIMVDDNEIEARLQEILAQQDALSQPLPTSTPTPVTTELTPSPTVTPQTPVPTLTATPYPTLVPESAKSAYDVILTRNGLTDQQFRDLVRSDILEDKLRKAIAAESPKSGPQVHARHILVGTQEQADTVHQQLLDGQDFVELAKQVSTDPGTKDKGGDLGWFGMGVMNAPFESAAFSQEIGAIGDVVQSPNGFHIIQVLERSDDRPFDDATIQRQSDEAWRAWISTAQVQPDVKNMLNDDQRSWVARQVGSSRRS